MNNHNAVFRYLVRHDPCDCTSCSRRPCEQERAVWFKGGLDLLELRLWRLLLVSVTEELGKLQEADTDEVNMDGVVQAVTTVVPAARLATENARAVQHILHL